MTAMIQQRQRKLDSQKLSVKLVFNKKSVHLPFGTSGRLNINICIMFICILCKYLASENPEVNMALSIAAYLPKNANEF